MWIVEDKLSYEIIGVNIHETSEGLFEIWVTKKDNKTKLVKKSNDKEEIQLIKDAIDFAIKIGDKVLELK